MINDATSQRVSIIVPFQEGIQYFQRTGDDTYTQYIVGRAHPKRVYKSDKAYVPEDILLTTEIIWQITKQYLPVVPRTNDYLLDAEGRKWRVLHVTEQFHENVYNLPCLLEQ